MEIGVRIIGYIQLVLHYLTLPIYLYLARTPSKKLPPSSNPILLQSATNLAKQIRNGELTSEAVVQCYVSRVQEVNVTLNAVVEDRFDEAIREAKAVDAMIATGKKTVQQLETDTPFLGVPITVKESCKLQGMSHCGGTRRRLGLKADCDGDAVRNVKRSGAIPIAVTNTPELCLSLETTNPVTGRTLNPYNTNRTCGGSSGGEGALLGAGASVIGMGSDVAGSIRIPAMYNGVFGHKPSPESVSINGHFPYATDSELSQFLIIGPIARYAEDLRPLLKVMAGKNAPELRLDDEVDLSKLKVYYTETAFNGSIFIPVEQEIKEAIYKGAEHLSTKYGSKSQRVTLELNESIGMCLSSFFGLKGMYNILETPDNPKVSYNLYVELFKSLFGFSQFSIHSLAFYLLFAHNGFVPRTKYQHFRVEREALRNKFLDFLGEDGVLLFPTHPTAAYQHNQLFTRTAGTMYSMLFNVLGFPSTNVPMGLNEEGMPIGFQVIAAPNQDRLCLAVAEVLEKGFGGWVPPKPQS